MGCGGWGDGGSERRSSGSRTAISLGWRIDRVTLTQTWPLQLDAVGAVHDAVEDGVADRRVAEHVGMPHRLTAESLRSGWLTRIIRCMADAIRSANDPRGGGRR